ncbi:hypothetical protein PVAP13_1KG003701 [Panicum virgatum]|uniref:Uncharacterized protein n=1 Tax=Panicum virgatum TaxID=38727 RepID=A0A8T0X189_PANVG|nr:hypothetical protein PVAP13_1KG003701 [Panicum virgatum]
MRASGDSRLAAALSSVIPRGRRGPESRRAGPRVAPDADGSGGPSDARPVQQPSRIGGTTLAWLCGGLLGSTRTAASIRDGGNGHGPAGRLSAGSERRSAAEPPPPPLSCSLALVLCSGAAENRRAVDLPAPSPRPLGCGGRTCTPSPAPEGGVPRRTAAGPHAGGGRPSPAPKRGVGEAQAAGEAQASWADTPAAGQREETPARRRPRGFLVEMGMGGEIRRRSTCTSAQARRRSSARGRAAAVRVRSRSPSSSSTASTQPAGSQLCPSLAGASFRPSFAAPRRSCRRPPPSATGPPTSGRQRICGAGWVAPGLPSPDLASPGGARPGGSGGRARSQRRASWRPRRAQSAGGAVHGGGAGRSPLAERFTAAAQGGFAGRRGGGGSREAQEMAKKKRQERGGKKKGKMEASAGSNRGRRAREGGGGAGAGPAGGNARYWIRLIAEAPRILFFSSRAFLPSISARVTPSRPVTSQNYRSTG